MPFCALFFRWGRAVSLRDLFPGFRKIHPALAKNRELFQDFNQGRLLTEYRFVVFDTELTGLNKRKDEIISIGAVRMVNLQIELSQTFHCYIRPKNIDPNEATLVHRITPEQLRGAPPMEEVLPDLAGRLIAQAVRVPTASVSAVDLAVTVKNPATVEQVNAVLQGAGGVIGTTGKPLVSTDLRARPESIVMALPETRATEHGLIRVFGWYDNEWGFSNRMLDMALRMG